MFTERMGEALGIVAKIDPQVRNNQSANSGAGVDMGRVRRLIAVVSIGANSGSVSVKLEGAPESGGAFTDVEGMAATAVTAANKVVTLEVEASQLPASQRFVKVTVTETASANATVSAVVLGGSASIRPASRLNHADVTEQVVKS